jgi:integrase
MVSRLASMPLGCKQLNTRPRRGIRKAGPIIFETAAKEPEWPTAYCVALLTAKTSMRLVELKRLKWADIDPFNRLVTVRVSKTDAGTRVNPLNDEAYSAIEALK